MIGNEISTLTTILLSTYHKWHERSRFQSIIAINYKDSICVVSVNGFD